MFKESNVQQLLLQLRTVLEDSRKRRTIKWRGDGETFNEDQNANNKTSGTRERYSAEESEIHYQSNSLHEISQVILVGRNLKRKCV